jgi:hypothetical protein
MPKLEQKNYRYTFSYVMKLKPQLEEAVRAYQKALELHHEKQWAEAERAYISLLMTDIISDRLSKRVCLTKRMLTDGRLLEQLLILLKVDYRDWF